MPSKLLILHGEAKSYGFTAVSSVPERLFNYLKQSYNDFLSFDMHRIKYKN